MKQNMKVWALYVAAFMSAVIAVVMVYGYVQNQIKQAKSKTVVKTVRIVEKPKTQSVVVAKRDIYRGEPLAVDDLVVLNVPVEAALVKGVITNPQDVVGKIARQTIYKGEWILPQKLSDTSEPSQGSPHPADILEKGHRMFRVSVSATTGLLGIVQPGDHVDVISTFESTDSRRMISRIILQNIEVLAVNGQFHVEMKKDRQSGGESKSSVRSDEAAVTLRPDTEAMLTLNVKPKEAELLALAMNVGVVQLSLRNSADTELVKTKGVSLKMMQKGKSRPPRLKKKSRRETIQILQGSKIEEVHSR